MKANLKPRVPVGEISRENVRERVYSEFRYAIMQGRFIPGQMITIQELANAFGTSTMPVREALRRLVAERALHSLRNRSVAIPALSEERLNDILRVRLEVEGAATEWAATKIGKTALRRLDRICNEMAQSIQSGRTRNFLQKNQQFRFTIYESAKSPTIMPIIESLWLQIGPYLSLLQQAGSVRIGIDHHRAALDALHRRDGVAARAAICEDMVKAAEILRERLQADASFYGSLDSET